MEKKNEKWRVSEGPIFQIILKNLWFISVSVNFTVDDTRKSINRFAFSNENASFGTGQYKS